MALQDLAVWWEGEEIHTNKARGGLQARWVTQVTVVGVRHGWEWLGSERQEVGKYLRADGWIRGLS